jgi:hypothetical protein
MSFRNWRSTRATLLPFTVQVPAGAVPRVGSVTIVDDANPAGQHGLDRHHAAGPGTPGRLPEPDADASALTHRSITTTMIYLHLLAIAGATCPR